MMIDRNREKDRRTKRNGQNKEQRIENTEKKIDFGKFLLSLCIFFCNSLAQTKIISKIFLDTQLAKLCHIFLISVCRSLVTHYHGIQTVISLYSWKYYHINTNNYQYYFFFHHFFPLVEYKFQSRKLIENKSINFCS